MDHDGSGLRYEDLCAKWNYYCYDNEILRLSETIPSIEANETQLTYPMYLDFNSQGMEVGNLPFFTSINDVSVTWSLKFSLLNWCPLGRAKIFRAARHDDF